ncbi:MAG: DUF4197 domain-containing protein [Lentisphaeria bacterium]|jgi:hypothetical protein|nr:DUF4197 domain-containing protein [Lentisphaeria bacterium]
MRTGIGLAGLLLVLAAGCANVDPSALAGLDLDSGPLDSATVAQGLKEALTVGTQRSVDKLAQPGGYAKNTALRLMVPEQLDKVAKTMRSLGLGSLVDEFEGKMNAAAEEAAAKAAPVFASAVGAMTFEDVMGILQGGPTAATDYFKAHTAEQLRGLYAPIIRAKMDEAGAIKVYNSLMERYNAIPFAKKPDFSLDSYVTDKALDGLFHQLGKMEQDIRENPAARTTALLRQVFAN